MELQFKCFTWWIITVFTLTVSTIVPSICAGNANVTIDYAKVGGCNSSTIVRVGDYCDHLITITITISSSSSASTDLSVEIIMPDNTSNIVMQTSKPSVTYIGRNFLNIANLYQPTFTMISQMNTSQFDDIILDFGTVTNNGLVAPNNITENTISINFRTVVISNPSYQVDGASYWVTVGIQYNNASEIWIGQSLFTFTNSSNGGVGIITIGSVSNSSLQAPQGSPFALSVPINYNNTYASNFVFTVTNNNPAQLGLCSVYVQSATAGFAHLSTLGYEISQSMTISLSNTQISIRLGQIVNTQSYSGSSSTLYIVVYGRVYKTDSVSSYAAGILNAQVSTVNSTVTQNFTIYTSSSVIPISLNGSLPTITTSGPTTPVNIYDVLIMRVTMVIPTGFSVPVTIDLNGALNNTTPGAQACLVVVQSAGENVGGSNPQCVDQSLARYTYTSSMSSTTYDHLSYDLGVVSNMGVRPTTYSSTVNTVVFDAVFQVLNTTQNYTWITVSISFGNNTVWVGTRNINVSASSNITNATQPTFSLSYDTINSTNTSATTAGYPRLFYLDIYSRPSGIYAPMLLRIITNEILAGSAIPAASICFIKLLYVGQNLRGPIQALFYQQQSSPITYMSRFNQRKNDTAYIQFGPFYNYPLSQNTNDSGRIRVGIYIKIENGLNNGQSTYVNLDTQYSPSDTWTEKILFTGYQSVVPMNVTGTPIIFILNSTSPSFNINALTIVNYGLKIPPGSIGTYSSLHSSIINEINQQTSVCRVDMSSNRGFNVPCSNDVSSAFTYNANGYSEVAITDLGSICSISSNSSSLNPSSSVDENTVIIQVFLLATLGTSSSFDLTLSNLIPSGQAALAALTSTFISGSTKVFGNITSLIILNATAYRQLNDTGNSSLIYLGQDILIRTQLTLAYNLTQDSCYPLIFQFSFTSATIEAAYFTNAFFISSGDNFMCMKAKATPNLSRGSSTLYNTSMYLDLGTVCYYPIDPTNITASTLIIQTNARVPLTTTAPLNSQIAINIDAYFTNNQSSFNTSVPFIVTPYTSYPGFIVSPADLPNVLLSYLNSTIQSSIRATVTYEFNVYLPTFAQGRLEIYIVSIAVASAVTVNIISADIISAGTNVGSFMQEYVLGNKYIWTYSSSIGGSSYQDTAYLDLGVITNTGTTSIQNTSSGVADNFITVRVTGYLTDSPLAEQGFSFTVTLKAIYASMNISNSYSNVVVRNGTERPIIFVNHSDVTSGSYGVGSTYSGIIHYGHEINSTAECVNAQIIIYLPTWISFQTYSSTTPGTNYTADNSSYVLFNLGTLFFDDIGSLTFTLNIGNSNQMAIVYQQYNSPNITIPYEFLCMKRPRTNVAYYPTSKIFVFADVISIGASITTVVQNNQSLLSQLDFCQFTSSVTGSVASLVRTTGWQTGYRSNQWMLSGGTYLQINFGNLTLINTIKITVPASFAPIQTLQLGYSWDGDSFAVDPQLYFVNGSSSYMITLKNGLLIRYLRVYIIDVVQPSDLLIKTSGFILYISGKVNSSDISISTVCRNTSNTLSPRTVLVVPPAQVGLNYSTDVYVCDETITRTSTLCYVLLNGDTSALATWTTLNTTVANIILFVYNLNQQIQSLYGYAQDGISMMRSDDRGLTWVVTNLAEYTIMLAACNANLQTCSTSESYPLTSGSPGYFQLQGGVVPWTASIKGLWTQSSGGTLIFDWFGY